MKKLLFSTMCALSFICASSAYAMDSSEFLDLNLRNGSKFPAKATVYYEIQGIQEDTQIPYKSVSVELAPINTDGVQGKATIHNPKRFGLVSVEVNGGITFHNVVDLISEIVVRSDGTVMQMYNPCAMEMSQVAPEWLLKSVVCKKFDLRGYEYNLSQKWDNLTEDQKQSPFAYDIPSCLHSLDTTPQMITPFSFCIRPEMKSAILAKYKDLHPEVNVTEEEILKLEAQLKEKGLPFVH